MPKATFEKAKEFLEKINDKDCVAVIHHDDTDGFVSGILLYDHCRKKGAKADQFTFSSNDDQEKIINGIKQFNKIVFSDLAPGRISQILDAVKGKEVLLIDHHLKDSEVPEEILDYRTKSEVSASKSVYSLVGGREWLKIVCELADVGYTSPENKIEIDKFANERGMDVEEVKEKFYFRIDMFLTYFYKDFNKAFEILSDVKDYKGLNVLNKYADEVQKELDYFIEDCKKKREKIGFVNYYYFEPKFSIKSRVTTDVSFDFPDEVFIFAIPKGDKINLSARNQSGDCDCSKLLKEAMKDLEDSMAGGHAKAAGGIILKTDLERFKKNLSKIEL